MIAFIILIAVGAAVVRLGLRIRKGNIDAIHPYHRQRVTDKAAFGKKMGLGTILCGAGMILFGSFSILAEWAENPTWMRAGVCLLLVSVFTGVGLLIYAARKYNQGVF